jgi:hypothetical protein
MGGLEAAAAESIFGLDSDASCHFLEQGSAAAIFKNYCACLCAMLA